MASFTSPARSGSLVQRPSLNLAPSSRYTDAIRERCRLSRASFSNAQLTAIPKLSISSNSQRANQEPITSSALKPKQLGTASTNFLGQNLPSLKLNSQSRRYLEPTRAYQNDFFKIKLPKIIEKPEWWWRTLACIPYLIAIQISDVGYYIQPFLERHESIGDMIFYIPGAIKRWPTWFFMAYCYIGYLWVVKNKDLPHYLRFHVMMGMLLETGLQILWVASNFFPLIHFNGRFGMYYWAAVGFTYICLLLECVRCALAGIYVQIPFISDAAFIHTLFHLGGFQRPLR